MSSQFRGAVKGRIRQALALAQSHEVGCQFWLEPEFQVSLDILKEAGLVAPIRQGVPSCDDHGCHLKGRCSEEARFQRSEDIYPEGISGIKFRLTEAGHRLLNGLQDDLDLFRTAVANSPLASAALRVIAQRGQGGVGSLELLGELLKLQERHLESQGNVPFELDRWQLGQWLMLMEALGLVTAAQDFHRFFPGPSLQGGLASRGQSTLQGPGETP